MFFPRYVPGRTIMQNCTSTFSLPTVFTNTKYYIFCEFFFRPINWILWLLLHSYVFVASHFCKFYENECITKVGLCLALIWLFKALIPNKSKNKHFRTIYVHISIFGTAITLEFEGSVLSRNVFLPDCTVL